MVKNATLLEKELSSRNNYSFLVLSTRKFIYILILISFIELNAEETSVKEKVSVVKKTTQLKGHTFGWPFLKTEKMLPRGGMSRGGEIELLTGVSEQWKALQKTKSSKKEQDRQAILALKGAYRVSFDFMEIAGFRENYTPPQPYFSWGTELVFTIVERPDFISLQHVMVMFFKGKDGKEKGPFIMKHWRQDWQYEDKSVFEFSGNNKWVKREIVKPKGKWTQAVYQVDDSPRYESLGHWEHINGKSTWMSEPCWRPLPRREYSVRDDYNVLGGKHEITITPNGWIHLQNNKKLNVSETSVDVVAHELGINRYERITSPDITLGEKEFNKERQYWQAVRNKWRQVIEKNDSIILKNKYKNQSLWTYHFSNTEKLKVDPTQAALLIKNASEIIDEFMVK